MIYHLIITSFGHYFFNNILPDSEWLTKHEKVVDSKCQIQRWEICFWDALVFIDSVNCIVVETMHLVLLRANYLYISLFNYWALCCHAYIVIFHLYLTLMFIDEDGFCYFIPLNAFRDYLQQSTSPIFFLFMDLQALGRNFIRPSFSKLVWLECCQMVHQLFVMPW